VARYTEIVNFLASREQVQYLREVSRSTGKSVSELLRELLDEQIMADRSERVAVILDKADIAMVEELCALMGESDVSRAVSKIITAFYILSRMGFWRFLRPIEEIYKMALEESKEG